MLRVAFGRRRRRSFKEAKEVSMTHSCYKNENVTKSYKIDESKAKKLMDCALFEKVILRGIRYVLMQIESLIEHYVVTTPNSINHILPNTPADATFEGKTLVIQEWIQRVLRKIHHYKAQHCSLLN